MADNNAPLGPNDRISVIRRDADGVGTPGSVPASVARTALAVEGEAIADIVVTGTYATDDDAIEAAVNGILAALRANGIIAEA